jgi:hypothetical protein
VKRWIALLVLPFVFLLAGCEDSNGWDAYPIGDAEDETTCYQIAAWHYDGYDNTKYWGKGVYCPADIEPKEIR